MATPTSIGAWTFSSTTGINQIDSLIGGTQWESHQLSFSFPGTGASWSTDPNTGYGPTNGGGEPWSTNYSPLTTSDKVAVRATLQAWANVADLTFTEVADNATTVGDLRFAYTTTADTAGAQAWAYFPGQSSVAGDVWINADGSSAAEEWDPGSYSYLTVLHEIGHALGLKHSFEPMDDNPAVLPDNLEGRSYTVMSYSAAPGNQNSYFSYEPTTPMVLDIAAIQYLYGANTSHRTGNDSYVFSGTGTYHQTIWDAGGTDTIVYQSATGGVIDLAEGGASTLGVPIEVINGSTGTPVGTVANVWIAFDAVIENATGGSGADRILGNTAGNMLRGGAGNDTIYGQTGNDTLNGGTERDYLAGGSGNDTYLVDSALDRVVEAAGRGTDSVSSSVTLTLAAEVERLTLTGSNAINGSGNVLANLLRGNTAANALAGGGGNDSLEGGSGNDTLNGGSGTDRVTGGAGADLFVLNSKIGSDTLVDFISGTDDVRISMAGLRVGDGDTVIDGARTRTAAGGFSTSAELVVFSANAAGLTSSAAAAAIGSATSAYTVGSTALFAIDNGSSSALFLFTASNADALVSASELTLLATLSGTAATTTGDYLFGT
ncbi:M10 family metallopeptidase [Piscinibacter defluvii]|uniref:M10 family metallopeptidase n=1 Tax=Piscinibacter defluvii TaxID=1796922 RepID=UPI000FDE0569|nr:M10 family metallopeptidase [Piscinibacter defluvii]